MKEVNIWETNLFNDRCQQFFTLEDLEKLLKSDEYTVFVRENFNPERNNGVRSSSFMLFEYAAARQDIILTYTTLENPILLVDKTILINPVFFEHHKDQIMETFYDSLLQLKPSYVVIEKELFDNQRFNNLIKQLNSSFTLCVDKNDISEENVTYLQENFIACEANHEEVSRKYAIQYYTLQELEKPRKLLFNSADLTERNIKGLKYLKDGSSISIADTGDNLENLYFYLKLMEILKDCQPKINLIINEDYLGEYLSKLDLNALDNTNASIIIKRDLNDYTKEEYQKEDAFLEELVQDIKNSKLSPFERYIAVYNIVKQFKPYKENYEDGDQSRSLKNILYNDYIVCVGFARLLEDLVRRVGISAKKISIDVALLNKDEEMFDYAGHARVLVYLKDPKYGIDGYYIADPTWDNNMDKDIYIHAAMTPRETTKEKDWEHLTDLDYLLDVESMEEFNSQINSLLDKKIAYHKTHLPLSDFSLKEESEIEKRKRIDIRYEISAVSDIFSKIIRIFRDLDYETYTYLYKKYAYLSSGSEVITKEDCYGFLTELGNYILPRVNTPITSTQLLTAAANVKIHTSGIDKENIKDIQTIIDQLTPTQVEAQSKRFPEMEIQSNENGVSYINPENKFEENSSHKKM